MSIWEFFFYGETHFVCEEHVTLKYYSIIGDNSSNLYMYCKNYLMREKLNVAVISGNYFLSYLYVKRETTCLYFAHYWLLVHVECHWNTNSDFSKFLYDCKKKFLSLSRLNISLKFLDVEEEHCFVNISVTLLYRLVRKDEDLCYWQLEMGINWSVIVSMAMWPFSFHLFKLIKYPCNILKQFLYSLFCGVFCFQSLINLSNVSFQLNLETWQLVYRTHP